MNISLPYFPVERMASLFSDNLGRPSKDSCIELGVLVLQQVHDLTDQEAVEVLALNIGWHCASGSNPFQVKAPEQILCDNVLNPAAPDASHNKLKGVGYLVQLMATFSDQTPGEDATNEPSRPDLNTHIAVGKMNVHDQEGLKPAISDTNERNIKPQELLADSHYGSNECL